MEQNKTKVIALRVTEEEYWGLKQMAAMQQTTVAKMLLEHCDSTLLASARTEHRKFVKAEDARTKRAVKKLHAMERD